MAPTSPSRRFGGDSPSVVSRSPGLALIGTAVPSGSAPAASSKFRSSADCHRSSGNARTESISDASTTTAPTSCTPSRMSSICSLSPPVVYMPSSGTSHPPGGGTLLKHSPQLAPVVQDPARDEGVRNPSSQGLLNADVPLDLSSDLAPLPSAVSTFSVSKDSPPGSAEVPSRGLKLPVEDERGSEAGAAGDTRDSSSSQCCNSEDGSPPDNSGKLWTAPNRQCTSFGRAPVTAASPQAASERAAVSHDVGANASSRSIPGENAQEILETAPLLESVTRLLLSPAPQDGSQPQPPALLLSAPHPPSPQPTSGGKTAAETDRRNLEMMLMMLTPLVSGSENDTAVGPASTSVNVGCSFEPPTASCRSPRRSASCSTSRAATNVLPFSHNVQQPENTATMPESHSTAQSHVDYRTGVTSVSGLLVSGTKAGGPNVPAAAKLPSVSRLEDEANKDCPTTSAGSSSPGSSEQSTKDGERKEAGPCAVARGERGAVENDAITRLQTWTASKNAGPQSKLSSVSSPVFSSHVVSWSSASSGASSASLPSSPKLSDFSTATLLSSFIALPPTLSSPAELGVAGLAGCCGVTGSSDQALDPAKAAYSSSAEQQVPIPHQLLVDLQLLLLLLFEHVCQLLPPLKRQDGGRFYAWHVQRLATKTHGTLFHYSDMLAPLCSGALFPSRSAGRRDGECGATPRDSRGGASVANSSLQATIDKKDSSWKAPDVTRAANETTVDCPDETTAAALDALELCAEGRGNEKSAGWSLLALLLLQGLPSSAAIFQCVSKCPAGNFLKVVGALERAYSLYQMSRVGGGTPGNLDEVVDRGESCSPALPTSQDVQPGTSGHAVSLLPSDCPGGATEAEKIRQVTNRRTSESGSVTVRSDSISNLASPASMTSIDAASNSVPLNPGRQHLQQRQYAGTRSLSGQQSARRVSDKCRPGTESGAARPNNGALQTNEGMPVAPSVGPRLVSGSDSIGGPEEEALATLLERPPLIQQQEFGSDLLFGDILKSGKEENSNAVVSWQAALASTFGMSPLCRAAVSGFAGRNPCVPTASDSAGGPGIPAACFSAERDMDTHSPLDEGHPRLFGYSRSSKRSQKEASVAGDLLPFDGVVSAATPAAAGGKKASSGGNGRKSQRKQQAGLSGPPSCNSGAVDELQRCTSSGSAGSCAASLFDEADLPPSKSSTTGGEFYLSASVNKRRHPSVQAEILRNCCSETLAERGTRLLDEVLQKLQGGAQQGQPACSWTREEATGTSTEVERRPSNSSRCSSIREDETSSSSGRRSRKSASEMPPADGPACAAAGSERETPLKCRRTATVNHSDPVEMLQPAMQASSTDEERLLVLMRKIAPSSVAMSSLGGMAPDHTEKAPSDSPSLYAKTEADSADECLKNRSYCAKVASKYGYEAARQLARQCRLEKLLSGEAHTLQKGMAAVFKAPVGTPTLPPSLLGHVDGSQVAGNIAKQDGLQSRSQGGGAPSHLASPGGSCRGPVSSAVDGTLRTQSKSAPEISGGPQLPNPQLQDRLASKTDDPTGRTNSVISGALVPGGPANTTDGLVFDRCCRMLLEQELAVALGDVRALCVEAAVAKGGNPEKVKELPPAECSSGPVVAASRRRSGATSTAVSDSFEQMMMLVNTCVDRDNAYLDVAAGNSSSSGLVGGTQGEMVFTGLPSKQDPGQFCF
ncbi:ap2 domain transcription factor ap2x-9 [Cystoisospora suis]|uniref:Ap2 domain transcription factor ap2x-9 n=1 Tax=Cystoisospora suis TaxID=483139 RepID=A0A2C6L4N0_9APIC|nr:ap2 domain transcription factor ap2x-9 [Cystoisospora suis]